jgi:hypothetical protein
VGRAERGLARELIRTSETFFPRRWVNKGKEKGRDSSLLKPRPHTRRLRCDMSSYSFLLTSLP